MLCNGLVVPCSHAIPSGRLPFGFVLTVHFGSGLKMTVTDLISAVMSGLKMGNGHPSGLHQRVGLRVAYNIYGAALHRTPANHSIGRKTYSILSVQMSRDWLLMVASAEKENRLKRLSEPP